MSYDILQSSTQAPLLFFMTDEVDHISGKTGLSPTVTIRKPGGAFGSPAGAVTEIANGWYQVAGNTTDTNTLGPLALHATATGADPCDLITANIVAYDPQDASPDANVVSIAANVITATSINANAINAAKLDPDVTTELQAGLATSTALSTAQTAIDAIKAKTDLLTFTIANQVDSNVLTIVNNGITAASINADAITAVKIAADVGTELATALLDLTNGIETSLTPRMAFRIMSAALAGILSGAATTTVTIRNIGNTKDRIVATVDADGNRSAVTADGT